MRSIKFRAFNRRTKELKEVLRIFFNENTIEVYKDSDNFDNLTWFLDHCELMQFTGLYDKNGKEIYEGDIIKVNKMPDEIFDEYVGLVIYSTEEIVCFRISRKILSLNKELEYSHYLVGWRKKEIIGNQFENPELLEPK